jgi:hypothetical protein
MNTPDPVRWAPSDGVSFACLSLRLAYSAAWRVGLARMPYFYGNLKLFINHVALGSNGE